MKSAAVLTELMPTLPTARELFTTLLPQLRIAANYAREIQSRIVAQPEKGTSDNFFSTALTDADLSVQTFIEVSLLSQFPQVRFYGEEHAQSYNTKYFRGITLGEEPGDYLITLDPIDGTRWYMDGTDNYQIVLTVLDQDDYLGVLIVSPATQDYFCTLRGEGCRWGTLATDLDSLTPVTIATPKSGVYISWGMEAIAPHLPPAYQAIRSRDYTTQNPRPNFSRILRGDLCGAVLRAGKWLDGAALAFSVREAGGIVTLHDGSPVPPMSACVEYQLPGLVVAYRPEVHADLLRTVQAAAELEVQG